MAENVTCDYCGKDLSTPSKMPGFRLRLSVEPTPTGGLVHAVRVYPPIERDYIFCNIPHLAGWLLDNEKKGKAK